MLEHISLARKNILVLLNEIKIYIYKAYLGLVPSSTTIKKQKIVSIAPHWRTAMRLGRELKVQVSFRLCHDQTGTERNFEAWMHVAGIHSKQELLLTNKPP